jgi:hypothetical protein
MGTEVWNRASLLLQNGLMVVGWYHSHPNLGVFFSGTDRATQSAFFTSLRLGLVIDPIRKDEVFFGGTSQELDNQRWPSCDMAWRWRKSTTSAVAFGLTRRNPASATVGC